jgi:hypothetical protein
MFWSVRSEAEELVVEKKPQIWGVATLFSRHYPQEDSKGRAKHYNEHNYGVGFEYQLGKETRLVGGEYRNSFKDTSVYLGYAWVPVHVGRHIHIGLVPTAVTGYEKHPILLTVLPTIAVEDKNLGFNVGMVPCVKGGKCSVYKVIGVQVKWKFQ